MSRHSSPTSSTIKQPAQGKRRVSALPVKPTAVNNPTSTLRLPAKSTTTQRLAALSSSRCQIQWPGCDGGCTIHPRPQVVAASPDINSREIVRYGTLSALVSLASSDLPVYEALVANASLPEWIFSTLVAQVIDYDVWSQGVEQVDQRVAAVLTSPRVTKSVLRQLARVTTVSDNAIPELLTHPRSDPSVRATTALMLGRLDTPAAIKLRTAIRTIGDHKVRACLLVAHFEIALPTHSTERDIKQRSVALLKKANKFLNRFNHCRPLALELAESMIDDWSASYEDFEQVITTLLSKTSRTY
jgi:hypothetical protein